MIDLQSVWPFALAAVVLLAVVILVLLLLLLRRSAKVSEFEDAEPPEPEPEPRRKDTEPAREPDIVLAEDEKARSKGLAPLAVRRAFSRAGRRLDRSAAGNRHRVPLFLLLGADGSRDSDLLANAGLELPFGGPAEAGTDLGQGKGFWFLDRGVVLDFAGDAVLSADGRGSDEGSWRSALSLLQKLRPKRPVDGIVLALSCRELLDAQRSEAAQEELAARAGRIYRKLWQMQQRLGFRLPVYLLVTGCERLSGFGSFCGLLPPALRGEMLGWSSPFGPDAAYRSGWVEEAFTAVGGRMDDLQMEVFADTPAAADSLFLLPGAVRSLSSPVRVFLDQLFKPSAYHESLILRGIYLSGKEEIEDASAAQSAATAGSARGSKESNGKAGNGHNGGFRDGRLRRTFFIKDLLNEKSFRESGLALPATRIIVARNRTVRLAQAMTVAAALILGLGTLWAWFGIRSEAAMLEDVLGDTVAHLRQVRQADQRDIQDTELKDWTLDLLGGMARMDFGYFGSVFVPSSWFSPAHRLIERAFTRAFEEIILQAVGHELDEEARMRIDAAALQESAPLVTTEADSPIQRIEEMPEFTALQRYVKDMQEVEKEGRLFNKLPESRDLRPLGELVSFAFEERLPESFYTNDHIYLAALREARYTAFDPARFRPDASWQAEKLATNFLAALYRRSPFFARLQRLALGLQVAAVQQPESGETQRFKELLDRMTDVEVALSGTELEWAFRRQFNLGPAVGNVLSTMGSAAIFDPVSVRRIQDAGKSGWASFQRSLSGEGSPLTGPILAVRDGRAEMQLSPATLLLQTALKTFLDQSFVASAVAGEHIRVELPPGTRLIWDAGLLNQATTVTAAYERFHDKGIAVLPEELRPTLDAVALERTEAQAADLIAKAQHFEPISPAVSQSLIEEEVRGGIGTFEASRRPVDELLTALARLRLDQPQSDLSAAVTSEANRMLRSVDRMLEVEKAYQPRNGSFSWWNGLTPASPAAWGANDPTEVQIYLEATRGRIATLAGLYAQPLLAWLTKTTGLPPEVRTLTAKWQAILDDLRDYEAKKPGNPVAALEDYIQNQMPKVDTRSCQAAVGPNLVQAARSLFALNLLDLSRQLASRCYSLAGGHALELYHDAARYFNQRLAGRYPFTSKAPGPSVPEADPEDVRAFFKLFDRCHAVFRSVPEGAEQERFLRDARRFVENIARAREFFASFLDAEKPEPYPSFDVEAAFRILREREVGANQIIGWTLDVGGDRLTDREVESKKIRWTLGEPVRLELRWASDGPLKPVIRTPRSGVSIRERTVVYEYTNRWSLLAALADNRATLRDLPAYMDDQPVTLALAVFTQPINGSPGGEVPTQVFLRLTVLAPGTTQALNPPSFPERAPLADEVVEENVL